MISGAAQADVALVMVPAGFFEGSNRLRVDRMTCLVVRRSIPSDCDILSNLIIWFGVTSRRVQAGFNARWQSSDLQRGNNRCKVPADGNFVTAIQRGNHKAGEIQGQTRQHSRLINLLGVKQLLIGVNKMDCDTAGYKKDRYDEISAEMINMLQKVGWKKEFILQSTPILPISGWMGDNLLKKSTNMSWWNGQDIVVQDQKKGTEKLHIDTVQDALNDMARPPVRPTDAAMRLPVSGIYKIKGVGDVIAGRVEQGMVKPGEEVPGFAPFFQGRVEM